MEIKHVMAMAETGHRCLLGCLEVNEYLFLPNHYTGVTEPLSNDTNVWQEHHLKYYVPSKHTPAIDGFDQLDT